ncbi:MAG: hypothetical protein GXP31_11750 [Kiritimatiellaeota bacterium]|nr:hypothetical protein [Kiritimatiellota bacterium]
MSGGMTSGFISRGGVATLLFRVALPLVAAAMSGHFVSGEPADSPYRVGYRILKIPQQAKGPLVVAFWYPTNESATLKKYVPALPYLEGRVALGAVPARGPFPLVVFSHGGIGAGICAMSWAEALAAAGFVVAAPDHHDKVTLLRSDMEHPPTRAQTLRALGWAIRLSRGKEKGPTARDEYEHRPREIRAVIDALLEATADKSSPFHGLVDPDRIGLTGVSFGSWTTWAVAGGIRIYHDPRVKAIVPMAPSAGRMDLGRIRVPQMIIFGEKETILLLDKRPGAPMKEQRVIAYYEKAFPPKVLVGIKGAEHLDFDPDGMMTRGFLRAAARKVRTTAEVRRNDPVTRVIVRFQTAFWRRYLRGDRRAEAQLVSPAGRDVYLFKAELHPR